jgi:hypothetical protein
VGDVEIKGQSFLGTMGAFGAVRGGSALARLRDEVKGDLADALRANMILAASWYPVAQYRELLHGMRRVTGEADALTLEVGRVSLERDVARIYKVMFRLLSPTTLLDQSDRLLKRFVRGEGVHYRSVEKRRGFVRSRYDGFTGFDRVVWLDFLGGATAALGLCGARNVASRVAEGGGDGDAWMIAEATYD